MSIVYYEYEGYAQPSRTKKVDTTSVSSVVETLCNTLNLVGQLCIEFLINDKTLGRDVYTPSDELLPEAPPPTSSKDIIYVKITKENIGLEEKYIELEQKHIELEQKYSGLEQKYSGLEQVKYKIVTKQLTRKVNRMSIYNRPSAVSKEKTHHLPQILQLPLEMPNTMQTENLQ